MPKGGSRPRAGRPSEWNHGPTVTIRIPEVFKEETLEYVRALDSGTLDEFVTKSFDSVTKPIDSVSKSKSSVTNSMGRYLTTAGAYRVAVSRGCDKSKDAFRSWSRRNPEQCLSLYGLSLLERVPGDKSNAVPSYEDVRSDS